MTALYNNMSCTNRRSQSYKFLANYITNSSSFLMTSCLPFPLTKCRKLFNMSFFWSYTMDLPWAERLMCTRVKDQLGSHNHEVQKIVSFSIYVAGAFCPCAVMWDCGFFTDKPHKVSVNELFSVFKIIGL